MTSLGYAHWRRAHLAAAGLLGLIAGIHCGLTFVFFSSWSPDAVWFFGTGLGLLLLSALNLSHIGVEPCLQPTTRLVRTANWVFFFFGIAATFAVPEPQAFVLLLCLAVQALASRWTLPGPI